MTTKTSFPTAAEQYAAGKAAARKGTCLSQMTTPSMVAGWWAGSRTTPVMGDNDALWPQTSGN